MTRKVAIPYKEVKLRVVGAKATFWAYRIQRLDLSANIPVTAINELGNPNNVGNVTDVPEISATFQAFDVSPSIWGVLAGYSPTTYPASGVDVSLLGYCDLVAYIKDAGTTQHLKCIHARYMRVTDFSFSYSVNGESTEEYTCAGSEKRYLANDVVVDSGAIAASAFTLSQVPLTLKNGNKLLSFIVDGVWKTEGTDYSCTASGVVTYSGGATSTTAIAVYHTNTAHPLTWTNISDSTVPAAIRGKNIPVTISANNLYRVQSVNIRGTFPNTVVKEMGNVNVVGYITENPNITGDISVLDVDNEIIALLAQGTTTGGTEKEFGVDEFSENTLQLDIKLKDPADNTTVKKQVQIPYMRITSDGYSSSVGNAATYTFNFSSDKGTMVVYSGNHS
jgi:hypothetical protein